MRLNTRMLRPTTYAARPGAPGLAARLRGLLTARRLVLLLMLLGLALRLWMIQISPLDPRFSNADDGDYYRRALRLAVTGQYIDDAWLIRPPLHVFFFALWLRLALLIGQPQLGVLFVQLVQVAVGVATVPLGYGIARRLFASRGAGLLFAGFLATWFPFVEQPSVLFSELLYGFLFLLHLWLLLRFDASGRLRELALAGLALGAAALTRSPALYALAFMVLWLAVRWLVRRRAAAGPPAARPAALLRQCALVVACCLAVVGPWTLRNYLVYERVIPVDTLGQINLWLDLDKVSLRNEHIETLRGMPQADRHLYALERAGELLAADPWRPFRNMWPTFQHIWKAQYVEDFFVKQSFFSRTLRDSAPLGLLGDVLWLLFTLGGLVGLAAPAREGLHSRLLLLAWVGYSLVTVLVFHVEPRYLVPLWTLIALYGAWTLSGALSGRAGELWRGRRANLALAAAVALAFAALVLSYRDYPAFVGRGLARERAVVDGERAYAAGDYAGAERAFRQALVAQPNFVDAQVSLALALAAQGRQQAALAELRPGSSRQADLVLAALRRDLGDLAGAEGQLARAESIAGEDVQRWTLRWLRPPPSARLEVGSPLALGYIGGFSEAERDARGGFRWLEGAGRVELPLPAPLQPDATVALRLAGGPRASTPLTVRVNGGPPLTFEVGGAWRQYRLPIPASAAGLRRLVVTLDAPTFVPARLDPSSSDARALSLMVGALAVE